MYQKKAFNRREQDYAMGLRRKLEEAEAMLQHLAPSRARSLALTKLDEALLWANVGIAEAGSPAGSGRSHCPRWSDRGCTPWAQPCRCTP